ncbi:chaperone SurA [bacterium BMS3Bbin07]|nr:chaperone SurA [bacterium BMS3Bbin07]
MRERYTSVSDMHSDNRVTGYGLRVAGSKHNNYILTIVLTMILVLTAFLQLSSAELIDRVVAFIDDEAITLTDFMQYIEKAKKSAPGLSEEEAINALINRKLLLREAKRIRLRGKSDDELIKEYIDIKVRVFIKIPPEEIERFYNENRERFGKTPIDNVRDDIERLLREREVNKHLKKLIKRLREKSYIKINLTLS